MQLYIERSTGKLMVVWPHFSGAAQVVFMQGEQTTDVQYSIPPTYTKADETVDGTAVFEELKALAGDLNRIQFTRSLSKMGADPEFFLLDKQGQVIPSYTKLADQVKGQMPASYKALVYNDGFQAEFSIDPQGCHAWVVDAIQDGICQLMQIDGVHTLSLATTVEIPQAMLEAAPDKYAQFGCTPSKNAYGVAGLAVDGRSTNIRSSGGHIHFEVPEKIRSEEMIVEMVKNLDRIVGIIGVSMFGKIDDARRRELYGLAGEYRTPAYGFEYRTLSSAWMCHPVVANFILGIARTVVQHTQLNFIEELFQGSDEEVMQCINTNDQTMAREIMQRNIELFSKIIGNSFSTSVVRSEQESILFKWAVNDVSALVKEPADLRTNWVVDGKWQAHGNGDTADVRAEVRRQVG